MASAGRAGRRLRTARDARGTGVRVFENAREITEMMMYTDADGEDAGWARRARKEDAASDAASGGERSVSTQRLEVRQRVLRLSSPLLAAGFERFDHLPDLIGIR